MKKEGLIIICLVILFSGILIFINAQNEMTIEANFQGYGGGPGEEISMIVPDDINLGSFEKDVSLWNETSKIYVNNTSGYTISVTPELSEDSPAVFEYLGFREYKTQNGTAVTPTLIGDYTFNITKNSRKGFYVSLNLTDFNGTLPSDNINLNATIKFVATALV